MNELKPCPCCGHTRPEIIGGPLYMTICRNSECQLQIPNCMSVNEAQEAWNNRAFEPRERHGDLIDRDHLLSLIEGWNEDVENDKQNENSFVVGKTLNGVIRIIRGAHAVIESEE